MRNTVYADPNSSKGFAQYDEETAQKENEKLLEQQEKEQKETIGKSTDCYLETLEVEGYQISPTFDKQTIEYVINEKLTSDEINIIALPSNEKAKVEGFGKIKLQQDQKQCKINVTAESGTVRTYTIYLSEQEKEEDKKEKEIEQEQSEEIQPEEAKKQETKKGIDVRGIIVVIIILFIGICIIWLNAKSQKSNKIHRNHRRR